MVSKKFLLCRKPIENEMLFSIRTFALQLKSQSLCKRGLGAATVQKWL